jgi:hypothetical protein
MRTNRHVILFAAVSVLLAIAAVWWRWTYRPPPSWYFPSHPFGVLVGLWGVGMLAGFGAVLPRSRKGRWLLQAMAGLSLGALAALPIDPELFEPVPVPHRSILGPIPGKPREEHLITVCAKPAIEKRTVYPYSKDDFEMLVLRPVQGEVVEVLCGRTFSPWYDSLPQGKELTFTVWQTKRVGWHTDNGKEESVTWESRIETIQDGDRMIYDARICPLHHIKMERVEVPIVYGMPSPDFFEAAAAFSGGPGFIEGGCVSDGEEHTEMAYRCPTCAAAYQKWRNALLDRTPVVDPASASSLSAANSKP